MGGRLEHEIRRIPHVVACSIVDDEIVVLIAPDAYQPTLERAIGQAAARAGSRLPVRLLGGIEPLPAAFDPVTARRRAVMVGSVAGVAALAATSLFAGLTGPAAPPTQRAIDTAPPPAIERRVPPRNVLSSDPALIVEDENTGSVFVGFTPEAPAFTIGDIQQPLVDPPMLEPSFPAQPGDDVSSAAHRGTRWAYGHGSPPGRRLAYSYAYGRPVHAEVRTAARAAARTVGTSSRRDAAPGRSANAAARRGR